jgi:hypothetical protein
MRTAVVNGASKLLRLTESEVIEVLGKPDGNELYKRNQKFYYYSVTPGVSCPAGNQPSERLVVRFNAMGICKEAYLERL